MSYTALHKATCEDEKLAELADEDPWLFVAWGYLLAAAMPWGRLPARIGALKARACPLVSSLTLPVLGRLVDRLIEAGILVRYSCPWTGVEAIAFQNYSRWNQSGRQYHRMGRPEIGPPPDWVPPTDLVRYIELVMSGKFKNKTVSAEAEKFGVPQQNIPKEQSQGAVPKEQSLGVVPRDYSGTETETETEERRTTSPALACARVRSAPASPATTKTHGNGHDPAGAAALTHEDLWRNKHGPPPANKQQREFYYSALTCYEKGLTSNAFGYDMPPQPTGAEQT